MNCFLLRMPMLSNLVRLVSAPSFFVVQINELNLLPRSIPPRQTFSFGFAQLVISSSFNLKSLRFLIFCQLAFLCCVVGFPPISRITEFEVPINSEVSRKAFSVRLG